MYVVHVCIPSACQEHELIFRTGTLSHPHTCIAIRAAQNLGSFSEHLLEAAFQSTRLCAPLSGQRISGIRDSIVAGDSYKRDIEQGKNRIPEGLSLGSHLLDETVNKLLRNISLSSIRFLSSKSENAFFCLN